nr:hypothetical protein [Planctomycetota bacterium]
MAEVVQFAGMIGPANLVTLVRNTAPWLFTEAADGRIASLPELVEDPRGWRAILRLAASPDWVPSHDDYF